MPAHASVCKTRELDLWMHVHIFKSSQLEGSYVRNLLHFYNLTIVIVIFLPQLCTFLLSSRIFVFLFVNRNKLNCIEHKHIFLSSLYPHHLPWPMLSAFTNFCSLQISVTLQMIQIHGNPLKCLSPTYTNISIQAICLLFLVGSKFLIFKVFVSPMHRSIEFVFYHSFMGSIMNI